MTIDLTNQPHIGEQHLMIHYRSTPPTTRMALVKLWLSRRYKMFYGTSVHVWQRMRRHL